MLLKKLKHVFKNRQISEPYELNVDHLEEVISRLEVRLEDIKRSEKDDNDSSLKSINRYLKVSKKELSNRLLKLKQYQKQQTILGDRNSYSKIDNDATFIRIKVDYMKNGQLKPAYNL